MIIATIAILASGCASLTATEPDACVTKTVEVSGSPLDEVSGSFTQTSSINIGQSLPLTSLEIIPDQSSLMLPNTVTSASITLNGPDGGTLTAVSVSDGGSTVFSGQNLAPFVSDGNIDFTVSIDLVAPSTATAVTLTLCMSATASISAGL
jgi:hypothetical protein